MIHKDASRLTLKCRRCVGLNSGTKCLYQSWRFDEEKRLWVRKRIEDKICGPCTTGEKKKSDCTAYSSKHFIGVVLREKATGKMKPREVKQILTPYMSKEPAESFYKDVCRKAREFVKVDSDVQKIPAKLAALEALGWTADYETAGPEEMQRLVASSRFLRRSSSACISASQSPCRTHSPNCQAWALPRKLLPGSRSRGPWRP